VLSCYTTNLVGHLRRENPSIEREFACAVNLSVRTDLPDGMLAFTQHHRIDSSLGYRGASTWGEARDELIAEFKRYGDVLAVANTRNLPWSPTYRSGSEDIPHWIRLTDQTGRRWRVTDEFNALLPQGEQHPHDDWVDDRELCAMLTPLPPLPPEIHYRDIHALGDTLDVPPPHCYRWLARCFGDSPPHSGRWIMGTTATLRYLAGRFTEDLDALRRHTEDLWAAGRHHQYRFAHNDAVSTAWGELSRSLRFAIQSADRGRPRPTLVCRAFEQILSSTSALEILLQ